MEIRKPEKRTPKYPAAEVVKKVGAAVAAAGFLAGMMTGCRQVEQLDGDVPYVQEDDVLELGGVDDGVAIVGGLEYPDVVEIDGGQDAVSCTDAECADSENAGASAE